MPLIARRLLLACLLIAALCPACAGQGMLETPGPSTQRPGSIPADILPSPADLPRSASAGDITVDGSDFGLALPNQAVTADATTAVFTPTAAEPASLAQMAFAVYTFGLEGSSPQSPIALDWQSAPAAGDLFYAIANWDSGRWDWYTTGNAGTLAVPGFNSYTNGNGDCLLALFLKGSGSFVLNGASIPDQPGGTEQGNWWSFGLNESGNRRSPFSGPDNSNVRWSFLTGHGIVSSAVFAADGTIYTGSYDGFLYAINPDGSEKWNLDVYNNPADPDDENRGLQSTPAVGPDGTVYIGSFDYKLYAVNPNGSLKWTFDAATAEIVGSPVLATDGTIYITSFDGNVFAVNPADGSQKWAFDTGSAVTGSCSLATDGTVYVGAEAQATGKYGFFAIDPANGTEIWHALEGLIVLSSPAVADDGTIYTGCENGTFYAFNPNGTEKWDYDLPILPDIHRASSSPAIGADGTIYFGTDWESDDDSGGAFFALLPNGTLDWSVDFNDYVTGSAAVDSAGNVYFGCYDGFVYSYDTDGQFRWSHETLTTDEEIGNSVAGSASIGPDGTVYIGSTGFHLYAYGTSL